MSATFEEKLAFGQIGEGTIEQWLIRAKGYSVLPVYDIAAREGKGPRLFTPDKNLIIPDLLTITPNGVRWIEAKRKSVFSWHRISSRWVTGIDIYVYEHYQEVAQATPWQIWLLFLHEESRTNNGPCPTGLYGGELNYLVQYENHRHTNWGRKGMVYWAHETLTQLATLAEVKAL